MSHWTSRSQQQTGRVHSHQYSGRSRAPRPDEAGQRSGESRERASGVSRNGAAYTVAHAGKQVRFGPVVFWIAVGTVVIMAVWSITSAEYVSFCRRVVRRPVTPPPEQQLAS